MASLKKDRPEEYEKIKNRIKDLIKYRDSIDAILNKKGGLFNARVAITEKLKEIIIDELPEDLDHKKERVDEIIARVEKEILRAM
tara:strand:- start:36393 stop:36647 length:255 start_codon:yes stop_codon:yes gene_type:complete